MHFSPYFGKTHTTAAGIKKHTLSLCLELASNWCNYSVQQDLHYPNTFLSLSSQKCSDRWICSDKWSHLRIYKTVINYSNITYTWSQNTLIKQSVETGQIIEGLDIQGPTVAFQKSKIFCQFLCTFSGYTHVIKTCFFYFVQTKWFHGCGGCTVYINCWYFI